MKRVISVILSISLVVTVFAGMSFTASADTVTKAGYTYTTTFKNYADAEFSAEGSVITKAPVVSYWNTTGTTTTHYGAWYNKHKTAAGSKIEYLYDGIKEKTGENVNSQFQSEYDSNTGVNFLTLKEEYDTAPANEVKYYDWIDDGSFYTQIEYDLSDEYGNTVDLDKIVICGETNGWSMGWYDLFVSDNLGTLYNEPVYTFKTANDVGENVGQKNTYNQYDFAEGTTARFVAIRIYRANSWTDEYKAAATFSRGTPHVRMREFNVYGTKNTDKTQGYTLTTAAYDSTGTTPIATNMETSLIRGKLPTKLTARNMGNNICTLDTTNTKYSDGGNYDITGVTSSTARAAGSVSQINEYGVRFAGTYSDGKKYIIDNEENYTQVVYALDGEAKIDSLVWATNHQGTDNGFTSNRFTPYHLKYSLANSVNDLFVEGSSTTYDVYNTESSSFLTLNLTDNVTAKYVGVRVICGVSALYPTTNLVALTNNNVGWARMTNISVNGTYVDPADANVTVAKDAAVAEIGALTVSKDVANIGNSDTNGKYPEGSATVSATESYRDEENKIEYTFSGWYNGEALVSANANLTYNLKEADINLTAKYDIAAFKYTLYFEDATRNVIGTIRVGDGEIPSETDVKAINAKVKDIYGYNVKIEDNMVVWNGEVFEAASGDKTFTACYEKKEIYTDVTLYGTDSNEHFYKETQLFDTAITLAYDGANSWVDANGNVLVATATGTLYACGDAMDIYAKSGSAVAPEVTIVSKIMDDGKFTVFAHATPNKTVKAYGILFASNPYKQNYDMQTDKGDMFTLKDTNAINKAAPSLKVSEVKVANNANVDFMATLTGCEGKVRHARAYVIYGDDTVVYSDIIITNN